MARDGAVYGAIARESASNRPRIGRIAGFVRYRDFAKICEAQTYTKARLQPGDREIDRLFLLS
jgi:hypothetical protein